MNGTTAISLFSGLGGMDIGLHRAGVDTLVTLDSDEQAAETLRANSARYQIGAAEKDVPYKWSVIEEDIHDVSVDDILKAAGTDNIDFIVGGPPCQTFSRSNEGNRKGTDTARGMLFEEFARLLQALKPKAFIFENVRGLASANDGDDLRIIKQSFVDAGYTVDEEILNAADYGVPQTRKRLFVIGILSNESPYFPEPTHVDAENTLTNKPTWITAKKALREFNLDAEITSDGGYVNAVGGKYGYLLKDIPPGGNYQHFSERKYDAKKGEYVERDEDELDEKMFDWRSRHYNYLLKQDPERPTWTLQASPGTYVGPFHWRSRRYSFLEQMRLMDIPVDYEIRGPPREIQRQIGNSVPPALAEAIVRSLMKQLNLSTVEREAEFKTIRADGGEPSINTGDEVRMKSDYSPWRYAEIILFQLKEGNEIIVTGRGKRIANVIDVVELVRRQMRTEPEFSFNRTVMENPDGSKSERLSVLEAQIIP